MSKYALLLFFCAEVIFKVSELRIVHFTLILVDFIEMDLLFLSCLNFLKQTRTHVYMQIHTTILGARKNYSEIDWTWAYKNRNIRDRFKKWQKKRVENKHANETTKHTVHQNGLKQYEHDVKLQQR